MTVILMVMLWGWVGLGGVGYAGDAGCLNKMVPSGQESID